ncbi:MAG: NUDIX domain-containing protein [Candidatus Paceibacterota bacterium]|jgi:8-oxo-dGTP diphosphatase
MNKGVSAIIKDNNKILILKRVGDVEFSPNTWDFPGGKVLENETFLQALAREVEEETNLEIQPEENYFSSFIYPNGKITIFAFKANLLGGEIKLDEKHTDYKWISKDNWKDFEYSLSTQAFIQEYFKS